MSEQHLTLDTSFDPPLWTCAGCGSGLADGILAHHAGCPEVEQMRRVPVRTVEIRPRDPAEVRARLLSPSSPIPRDVAEAFLEEMERGD